MSSLYRRNKIWWIKYYEDGKTVRKSLETKLAGIAKERQLMIDRGRRPRINKTTLQELCDLWLAELGPAVSLKHLTNCKHRVGNFIKSFPEASTPSRIDVQDWVNSLIPVKAANTVAGFLRSLSAFCGFLLKIGEIKDNPCRGITLPKAIRQPPRFLNDDEVDKVLALAKEYKIYLPVLTALQTGLRMSELREITWQHIDLERRLITIPHTKTNRPRSVPITAKLAAELDAVKPKTGPLFRGQQGGFVGDKQWRELLKPLQDAIPKFKDGHKGTGTAWHLLRHTFASRYVQAGGDIYRLAKILGHSNVTTTQIYAHLAPAHDDIMERI